MTEKKKYAIWWNVGYGDEVEILDEPLSEKDAEKAAYEAWRTNAEDSAEYGIKEVPEGADDATSSRGHVTFYDDEDNEI